MESFEAPAAIEKWAKSRRHEVTYTHLYSGGQFPQNISNIDFLVVMGGPQSPATTKEECHYFDAKREIEFIKRVIDGGKLALGVCLGAQLIGEALGARFEHSPNREIGVFEITLTADAKDDPFFSTLPKKFSVGHWHSDMPGLTSESKILAKSKGCPRQIVQYAPVVYGLQCHFEFTRESIEGMIENSSHELEAGKNLPYVQSEEVLRRQDYSIMNGYLFQFLDYLAAAHRP